MNRTDVQHLVEQMAIAWMQRNVAAIVALFNDDGQFISPGGAVRGHAAIAAAATKFFTNAGDVTVTITRVLIDGAQGVVEWTWRETNTATGEQRTIEDAIVFQLRDGKLAYWREYFDPSQKQRL